MTRTFLQHYTSVTETPAMRRSEARAPLAGTFLTHQQEAPDGGDQLIDRVWLEQHLANAHGACSVFLRRAAV
jgi:hypothetical protein